MTPAKMALSLFLTFIMILVPSIVSGHGMILDPPSRSSLWRLEEFALFEPPENFDDNALWCGGLNGYIANGLKCGLCGDPYNATVPRENEDGGKYDTGIISRYYKSGEVISAFVNLTTNHLGFMTLKLCPEANLSEECFDKHVLTFPEQGNSDKYMVVDKEQHEYNFSVQLPKGLQCSRCVVQWQYTAGNNVGECSNGTEALGCGPQETFRNCADVTIL